jgi:hypothetical protein
MFPALRAVFFATVALLPVGVPGQATAAKVTLVEPVKLTPYSSAHKGGRRIISNFEILEFHLPRFAHITKVSDVDYVEYYVRYGPAPPKVWLKFMFGLSVGGYSPDDLENTSIKWTARKQICNGSEVGTDWRCATFNGRRWRHVSVLFGFAEYRDVPAKAADYFDKILDTVSCGRDPSRKP